jgi:3-carboxy-cis,cis-muconate cycloisomerase
MLSRTLLQPAPPTTFGLKAAGWLAGAARSWSRIKSARHDACVLQFGGASGTLAAQGDRGLAVADALGRELGLPVPDVPWHAYRDRLAALVAACGIYVGVLGKMARDVSLLMQFEVGEAAEPGGGSSTMPHKRNPVGCAIALAAAARLPGLVSTSLVGLVQEHERAVGAWHAEWPALSGALGYAGGAAAAAARALASLEVDAERMRANIDPSALAERVTFLLAEKIGLGGAREVVAEAAKQGRLLPDALREDERVALSPEELAAAFEPATYLGSSGEFVDRVLEVYRAEVST